MLIVLLELLRGPEVDVASLGTYWTEIISMLRALEFVTKVTIHSSDSHQLPQSKSTDPQDNSSVDDHGLPCPDLGTLELVSTETSVSPPWLWDLLLHCVRTRHTWGKPLRKLCLRDWYARDGPNLPEANRKQLLEFVGDVETKYIFSTRTSERLLT